MEHLNCLDARFSLKGSTAMYAPDRTFDTEHIRLDLKLDIERETVRGLCQVRLRAITSNAKEMVFDAVNFRIQDVRWNGKRISYQYKDGKLRVSNRTPVKEGQVVHIDIKYQIVRPVLGLYFIKPDKNYPKRAIQVWTQGEDEYARYWFPCYDSPGDRTTSEIVATVPAGFTAVSNGRLIQTTNNRKDRTTTFHWRQDIPHAVYLVTLTAGRFTHLKDKWRGMAVDYYCEKGREADTKRAFGKTPRMLEFFSRFIGTAYPYAKYAQIAAADFIYGGMENTSATTQTDSALLDERAALDYTSDELVAHELAHQWFGDYLTCKDWPHAWLNESFATYFDALFKRFDKGEDEYLLQIKTNAEAYFQEDKDHYRRSIVTKVYKRPTDLFDRHLYEKGSVVLYMLHRLLGEELFQKSIRFYVRKNRGRVVETPDLINAIEEATGRNPRRFFDQWVYGAGHPEFKVRAWWDARKKEINLRVTQTHGTNNETGLFAVETAFSFITRSGERREKVKIDAKSHLFKFKLDSEPQLISFDPDHAILKRVDFPKPEKMWILQLTRDKNVWNRMDAAQALGRIGSAAALKALRKALLSDPFWAVRAEAASAIGQMKSEESSQALLHCLDVTENLKVRRAIYSALRSFKSKEAALEIEKRYRKEASYFAEGEALRALGDLQHPRHVEILQEALGWNSWNDVIRMAALEGFAATRSRDHIPLYLTYTKPGHSQKLRMAAIRCLMTFEPGITEIQDRLLQLLDDSFLLVRIAAVRALHQVGDERAVPALKDIQKQDVDGRLKRLAEEAIEKITKGFESN